MKNVCKRLFSLMLVMVLLVSIVPFQASAAPRSKKNTKTESAQTLDDGAEAIAWTARVNGSDEAEKSGSYTPKANDTVEDLLDAVCEETGFAAKNFDKAYKGGEWSELDKGAALTDVESVLFYFNAAVKETRTIVWNVRDEKATDKVSGEYTVEDGDTVKDVFNYVCNKAGLNANDFVAVYNAAGPELSKSDALTGVDGILFVFKYADETPVDPTPNPNPEPEKVPVWVKYEDAETLKEIKRIEWTKDSTPSADNVGTPDGYKAGSAKLVYVTDGKEDTDGKFWYVFRFEAKPTQETREVDVTVRVEGQGHDKDSFLSYTLTVPKDEKANNGWIDKVLEKNGGKFPYMITENFKGSDSRGYTVKIKKTSPAVAPDKTKATVIINLMDGDELVKSITKNDVRNPGSYITKDLINDLLKQNKLDRDYDVKTKNGEVDSTGTNMDGKYTYYVSLVKKGHNSDDNYVINFFDKSEGRNGATVATKTLTGKNLKVKDVAEKALRTADFDREYRNNEYEIVTLKNKEFEKNRKGVYEVTIEVKQVKKTNVIVTFENKGHTVGDSVKMNVDKPSKYEVNSKNIADLMKKAGISSKDYSVNLKDRDTVDYKYKDGKMTVTVKLDKIKNETVYATVYAEGKKDPVVKNVKITISSRNIKEDGNDWLADALGKKYRDYKYDYKLDYNKSGFDKKGNLTLFLNKIKNDNTRKYDIYLDIYTNGSTKKPATTVKITNGVAKDGKVTLSEAKGVVKEYYTAKNSDGIDFDGLWLDKGQNNLFNSKDRENTIDVSDYRRNEKSVHIAIKADNVKAKTSNGNPKTGDEIFITVTVMAVSAMALAGAYVFNKKRMAN